MSRILFILSGSIACYKACEAISQLVQRGHQVRTVATPAALRFVGTATMEALTREKVGVDLFEPGAALEHITLARWSDVMVLCPATANLLNGAAAGLADDLAGALVLAREPHKPLLIAPAMNPLMWANPATRAAMEKLEEWGAQFIAPEMGRTACGETGEGRLAAPETIVSAVESALMRPTARRLRVLITSGGTSEPIDAVRIITNQSTGATGALIAERFVGRGHDVLLLRARSARSAGVSCREHTFGTFAELDAVLAAALKREEFDVIIHAAAVSDFSVAAVEIDGVAHTAAVKAKLGSDSPPVIRLKANPKLLETFRRRSRKPDVLVVGFKLTQGADDSAVREAVERLLRDDAVDLVVHNDLAQRGSNGAFPATIYGRDASVAAHCPGRVELADALESLAVSLTRCEAEPTHSAHAALSRHR